MSLILDALARAERDKRREAQPLSSMLADAQVPEDEREAPDRRLIMAVTGGAGLLLGSLAVALWLRGEEPAVATSPVSQEPQRAAMADAASPPAPQTFEAPPRGGSADEAEVASLYAAAGAGTDGSAVDDDRAPTTKSPAATPEKISAATREKRPAATREDSPAKKPETGQVEAARADGAPEAAGAPEPVEARSEEPVDLETLLREVRVQSAAQGLSDHPVPLLATLSKQFRDSVPTLMYLRHDFNSQGESTVLINGETLRAGGRTRGVELREILADSVICSYEGTDFRLRALNSWVNL